jgi:hypothetical protein
MKIKHFLLGGLLLIATTSAQGKPDPFTLNPEENLRIAVHNRILAKVNGKAISVIDVMKKMDIVFFKEYPEYTSSKSARFQFYSINWKTVLQELINKELIMADAEENKLVITNGDVRQEMEQMFGPNIIANLDKIGMTLDEAWKIVKGDITIRRMMMIRVNSKAMRQVGPKEIRTAYEELLNKHVKSMQWKYHVISIRGKDGVKSAETANKVDALVKENPSSVEELKEKIKALAGIDKSTSVNVSEEFSHNELQLSPAYKEILTTLQPNTYSSPISQRSRSDKSTVFRIFYLKELVESKLPPFQDLENKLKDKLMQEAVGVEGQAYLKKLRTHYAVHENALKEMVPEDFHPFTIE